MSDAFPLIRKQIQLLKKINYEEFVESYKNSINNPWEEIFNDLLNFKNKYNVLPKYNSDEPYNHKNKLAIWLKRQRDQHKKQRLSPEKFKLLDSIGIVWDTEKQRRDSWNSKYNKLIEFRKTNPDRWPNSNSKDKKERALGRWCLHNRQWEKGNLKKFRFGDYPKERKQKLDRIGFVWAHGIKWEDNFIKLKRNINPDYLPSVDEDKHFYYWLSNQYQYYINKKLSDEKIEKLKQIGFEEWHLLRNKRSLKKYREDKWEENYNKLRKYIDENQNKLPSYNTDQFIYQWIFRQINKYHRGELSEYQISKLNQIGIKDWLNHPLKFRSCS
jgi:hypothetical protein